MGEAGMALWFAPGALEAGCETSSWPSSSLWVSQKPSHIFVVGGGVGHEADSEHRILSETQTWDRKSGRTLVTS